jgi:predicted membrane protein
MSSIGVFFRKFKNTLYDKKTNTIPILVMSTVISTICILIFFFMTMDSKDDENYYLKLFLLWVGFFLFLFLLLKFTYNSRSGSLSVQCDMYKKESADYKNCIQKSINNYEIMDNNTSSRNHRNWVRNRRYNKRHSF